MIDYGKFIIDNKKKGKSFFPHVPAIQICNSGQILWSRMQFYTKFPGAYTSRLLHVLLLIRFTLQVHIGAIITSLYNTHINRLLINHRSAHTSDGWLWTFSQLPSLLQVEPCDLTPLASPAGLTWDCYASHAQVWQVFVFATMQNGKHLLLYVCHGVQSI